MKGCGRVPRKRRVIVKLKVSDKWKYKVTDMPVTVAKASDMSQGNAVYRT